MTPELLALLLACKAQMEADAVEIDKLIGWVRPLDRMIDQGAMPEAWTQLVDHLAKFAEHNGSDDPQYGLKNAARNALSGTKR
jgi:hypothetical protein